MDLIIFILIVYGVSMIVTQSKIFEPLRDWAEKVNPKFLGRLISCMQCFPFWAGVFIALVIGPPLSAPDFVVAADGIFFTYLFTGALSSGTTYLIHILHIRLLGESWVKSQAVETERKKQKGIIKE